MNILITAGGTQEKIDQVRSITNTSSGKTATGIAQHFFDHGFKNIFFVHSDRMNPFLNTDRNFAFTTSDDLERQIKSVLSAEKIDVVVHAAAVSDYVVDKVVINGELFLPERLNKINSADEIEIILKKRSKIIDSIKNSAKWGEPVVIGFKLTNSKEPTEQLSQILKLSLSENVDFVVHNDLSQIQNDVHPTAVYCKDQLLLKGQTKQDLYKNLFEILKGVLP